MQIEERSSEQIYKVLMPGNSILFIEKHSDVAVGVVSLCFTRKYNPTPNDLVPSTKPSSLYRRNPNAHCSKLPYNNVS